VAADEERKRVIAGDLKEGARVSGEPSLPTMQRTKTSVFDALETASAAPCSSICTRRRRIRIGVERGAGCVHFVEKDAAALARSRKTSRCRVDRDRAIVHRGSVDFFGPERSGNRPRPDGPSLRGRDAAFAGVLRRRRYPLEALLLIEHRRDSVPADGWGASNCRYEDFRQSRVTLSAKEAVRGEAMYPGRSADNEQPHRHHTKGDRLSTLVVVVAAGVHKDTAFAEGRKRLVQRERAGMENVEWNPHGAPRRALRKMSVDVVIRGFARSPISVRDDIKRS
jgi:hypothetical protein